MTSSTADLQAALHGVRALLLDLDGVIILKGEPVSGSVDAIRSLEERQVPYRIVTNKCADRVRSIEDGLTRAGLAPQRVMDEPRRQFVLGELLQACWSPRPAHGNSIGPSALRIESQSINTDGQDCRTIVLSAWPRAASSVIWASLQTPRASSARPCRLRTSGCR